MGCYQDHGGNPAGSPKRAAERNRGASLYGSTGSGHAKHASDWDSTVGSGAPVRQVSAAGYCVLVTVCWLLCAEVVELVCGALLLSLVVVYGLVHPT